MSQAMVRVRVARRFVRVVVVEGREEGAIGLVGLVMDEVVGVIGVVGMRLKW